jgi:cytochrome c oxidase assembly factor CtaG
MWTAWNLEPGPAILLYLTAIVYALALRRVPAGRGGSRAWRAVSFYAGLAAVAVALLGPLDTFNDESFSIHMGQHVALMLVAAPLLLAGKPVQTVLLALPPRHAGSVLRGPLRRGWVRRLLQIATHPATILVLFCGNLLLWHWPALYEAALKDSLIHELEHAVFFSTALLFWWPIIAPVPRHHRLAGHVAILVLFLAGTVSDLLGLTLLLAQRPLYPFYEATANLGGLSDLADQRLSGLIMLASGLLVTFGGVFLILARSVSPEPTASEPDSGADATIPAPYLGHHHSTT